jgi:hypothetical protein
MKKVRYLAGAVGVVPVLGLAAGNAAAAVTHPLADKGKAVSLAPLRGFNGFRSAVFNYSDCPAPRGSTTAHNSYGLEEFLYGQRDHSCISRVNAYMKGNFTNLDMRTRYYNTNMGKIGDDHFNTGKLESGYTVWAHTTAVNAAKACIELVWASTHNDAGFPAVCRGTSNIP